MDDVNALGFSDLCRHVRRRRQLVVSTHENRLASLFERKLTPRTLDPAPESAVSYYNSRVEIHLAARKHGIADADIEHAVEHAMTIDNQEDDTRLHLGPARSAALLEVVTIVRDDGSEIAIHAMRMRAKYRRLLPGG
jgi:hypothetical protein